MSLAVIGLSLRVRAMAAFFKWITLGLTGLWVLGSTVWHALAIGMAQALLKNGTDPMTRKLADDIIKAQESEIAMMKDWLAKNAKQ